MKKIRVYFNSIDNVKDFVDIVSGFQSEIQFISGSRALNAKSIMGIFSLDLSEPIELKIESDQEFDQILPLIKDFLQ